MNAIDILGLTAACLTTASFVPQAIKTIKYKNTDGISLLMYIMFVIGVAGWLAYGLIKGDLAITLANCLTLIFSGSILLIKIRNDLFNKPSKQLEQ